MEQNIRAQVGCYMAGQISLNDLRLWILPLLWTIDRESDVFAFEMAATIARYIAEYAAGQWTEQQMRGLLGPFTLPREVLASRGAGRATEINASRMRGTRDRITVSVRTAREAVSVPGLPRAGAPA
jgi:hypothetical protein